MTDQAEFSARGHLVTLNDPHRFSLNVRRIVATASTRRSIQGCDPLRPHIEGVVDGSSKGLQLGGLACGSRRSRDTSPARSRRCGRSSERSDPCPDARPRGMTPRDD
jgi:hypothetical protein